MRDQPIVPSGTRHTDNDFTIVHVAVSQRWLALRLTLLVLASIPLSRKLLKCYTSRSYGARQIQFLLRGDQFIFWPQAYCQFLATERLAYNVPILPSISTQLSGQCLRKAGKRLFHFSRCLATFSTLIIAEGETGGQPPSRPFTGHF